MTSRELMVDDWVQTNHDGKIIKYQVHMLSDDNIIGNYLVCREVDPVPLTAEILEKNGFGYKEEDGELTHYYLGDRQYLDNPDLHIGTYNNGVYWLNHLDNAIHGIRYVHELQHAFRICNIGKEIEL